MQGAHQPSTVWLFIHFMLVATNNLLQVDYHHHHNHYVHDDHHDYYHKHHNDNVSVGGATLCRCLCIMALRVSAG